MQTNRIWAIGAAVIIVAILALGFFLGISPKLSEASSSAENRQAVDTQNLAQESVIAGLKADNENLKTLESQLAALRKSIPEGSDIGPFITELHSLESKSNVKITSISPADPVGFVPAAPVVPVAPAPAATDGAAPTPAPTADPAATPEATAPAAAPTDSLSPDQFLSMNVSIAVSGKHSDILKFVDELQNSDRLFLITSLTIQGDEENAKDFIGQISGSMYVLLDPEDAAAAATPTDPAAPAATATPAP